MKIFVTGLPYDLDDAELEEFFEKFGTVASAKVAIDKATGKSRGFGFVDMPNAEEGKEAIEGLNDLAIGRKKLVVKEAEERAPGSTPPRPSFRPEQGGGRPGGGGGFNRNRSNDRPDRDRFNPRDRFRP